MSKIKYKTLKEVESFMLKAIKDSGIKGVKSISFTPGLEPEKFEEEEGASSMLRGAFVWASSKEGHAYWSKINEKLESKENN